MPLLRQALWVVSECGTQGSDFTCYPFSTQNSDDYENLMKVYLDAAFFPLLNENDFAQEVWNSFHSVLLFFFELIACSKGHRFEYMEAGNTSSPLQLKGVVYNEMKGAMASQGRYLPSAVCLQCHLRPYAAALCRN